MALMRDLDKISANQCDGQGPEHSLFGAYIYICLQAPATASQMITQYKLARSGSDLSTSSFNFVAMVACETG
jgi:hypothetical protein